MPESDLVEVSLLEIPVDLWDRANEESKDLMREFTLISLSRDAGDSAVPAKLVKLADELQRSYSSVTADPRTRLETAVEEGRAVIERLDYLVPRTILGDLERLGEALDEADEYCRRGKHLLSLAASPQSRALRGWFLDEFKRQLSGEPPTAWPESPYAAALGQESVG